MSCYIVTCSQLGSDLAPHYTYPKMPLCRLDLALPSSSIDAGGTSPWRKFSSGFMKTLRSGRQLKLPTPWCSLTPTVSPDLCTCTYWTRTVSIDCRGVQVHIMRGSMDLVRPALLALCPAITQIFAFANACSPTYRAHVPQVQERTVGTSSSSALHRQPLSASGAMIST